MVKIFLIHGPHCPAMFHYITPALLCRGLDVFYDYFDGIKYLIFIIYSRQQQAFYGII